ncbi:beta-glucosidase [Cohnella faecalis]|uniref:Beta-glucosidase n=2 Tax=Cohnella faecalis TaxID=2315694 RepID=A0A398CW32_9BACL|nr:beta-glucosidase [Cohnella faecalis]
MCQYQDEIERLGVKKYKHGTEAAHGIAWLGEATYFPQPTGLACTWDTEVLKQVGEAIGTEARGFYRRDPANNGLTLWAPTVDMERDPRWGRNEEAYGEDPHLTGKLASALVKGIQGEHPFYLRAVASLKHFIGNNNEIDRGECSVSIDPRNMREYYLKAFEIPFTEGGAQSMMTSYNSVNGVPANLNPQVNDIVKKEWGMDGFVVSDAGDVLGTVNDHRYYTTYKEAVAYSILNGIDSITDDHGISKQAIRDSLAEKLLTENDLDVALRNAFRVRMRLGEFDPEDRNPYASIDESAILAPEHKEVSLLAARKSVVLLKNENEALPLDADGAGSIAIVGPLAGIVYRDWYSGTLPYTVTPLEAIQRKMNGRGQVVYASGNDRVKLGAGGKYVVIGENGKLAAAADTASDAEVFEVTDWGWRANTIVSESTGQYLTTADDRNITADSNEIFGWFTKEVFLLDGAGDVRLNVSAWNAAKIGIVENGLLAVDPELAEERSSLGSPEEKAAAAAGNEARRKVASVTFDVEKAADGLREAVEAARGSKAAIVFVGNHPLVNGKETIDRPGLSLPEAQLRLIREVAAVNPKTIVVIVGSYPFTLEGIEDEVSSIVYASHAGPELGTALADVLYGDYAPAGRLNMTWYRSEDQLPDFMDYDIIAGERTYQYFQGKTLYSFGHGLTYSAFEYDGLELNRESVAADGEVEVSLNVRNAGARASDEVVQLYIRADKSRVKRPLKQLIGFRRIHLEAGQSQSVRFNVKASELAFWDVTRDRWCVESGAYTLMIGRSSEDIAVTGSLTVVGEIVPPRNLRLPTPAINYDSYSGVIIDECKEGGSSTAAVSGGAWIGFSDAKFAKASGSFEARVSAAENGTIEIRLGSPAGEIVGVCEVPATGGTQAWHTLTCAVNVPVGRHETFLTLSAGLRLSSFRFV